METFTLGEEKIRPGQYARITDAGATIPGLPSGIVAAIFRSSWGPLGVPQIIGTSRMIEQTYGTGGTTSVLTRAARRARSLVALRAGTGGVKATFTLQDTTGVPINVVRLDAKHAGIRGNAFRVTKRTSLTDATKEEFLLFEGTTLLESFSYTPTADEPQALTDAINANSSYLDATRLALGTGIVADSSLAALATGTDPTVDGAAYGAALDAIESQTWNVLAVDSVDPVIHTTIETFIDRVRNEGKRVMAVVGEPTSVTKATRQTNAKAINHRGVVYVGHGYKIGDTVVQGFEAAARVAGMVAASELTDSLTNTVIDEATDVSEALSNADIEAMIQAGVVTFGRNALGQIVVEYGITSLTTLGADEDAGWKKIRRVRTRDLLMMQMAADAEPLRGKVSNSEAGRALVLARYQGTIDRFISRGALLPGGKVTLDPANPPVGDSAWFIVAVDDLDSIEKTYSTFEFRFSPAA